MPGEEEKETSTGIGHIVELEGKEIELRQQEPPLPEGGGTEAPSSDMTRNTMRLTEPVDLPGNNQGVQRSRARSASGAADREYQKAEMGGVTPGTAGVPRLPLVGRLARQGKRGTPAIPGVT